MKKVLIVEDEYPISELIRMNLDMSGYSCEQAFDGEEALRIIKMNNFDIIILDIMLPKIDGYQLINEIRHLEIPVVFLTAKNSVVDRVKGLKMGADDYITKPFECIELIARIETVLRRVNRRPDKLVYKDVVVNLNKRIVAKNNQIVDLTLKEYELLVFLIEKKEVAHSREVLLDKVWGYEYIGGSRTIDIHIQKLRKKLDFNNEIKTIHKYGYKLEG